MGMTDFNDIRGFLEPPDRAVQQILRNRASLGTHRAEFTCEWFHHNLNDFVFGGNKMMLITGSGGCGKTMLSDWIVESLRGSMDSDPYDVICSRVWADIPETASSLSLVKDLFMQALNRNIGDPVLISSARRATTMAIDGSTSAAVEKILWEGLAHVASHSKLMIVVDGLDEMGDGQHAVLDHLHSVTAPQKDSKVIVLSRPLQKPAPSNTQLFSISEKTVLDDIQLLLQSRIEERESMSSMSATDRKEISQKIADKSQGSFLWAECAFQHLQRERKPAGFIQWLAKAPKSIEQIVEQYVQDLQLDDPETKSILSWVFAAERPLSLTEIKHLLEIDTKSHTTTRRHDNIAETIRHTIGPLVDIIEGHVCIKHPAFRPHVLTFHSNKFQFDLKHAQSSLTLKLLAYVKLHVHEDVDVTWRPVRPYEARTYFARHALLEYATRYWSSHFRYSRFYNTSQHKLDVDARFRQCWPSSTLLATLEGSCFHWGYVSSELEISQTVTFELRKTILGHHSTATLQSLLFRIQHRSLTQREDVAVLAYEAWQISQTMSHTSVALACAEAFVSATESRTIVKKRTETVTRREEMLRFLVATYKRTGGVSHELTIRYTKILAELYVSIHETEKAVVLYRELYNVSIERYGYFHSETVAVYDVLIAQLKVTKQYDAVLEIVCDYYSYVCKTLSVSDERRVKSTMTLVSMYEERKETTRAEEVLVSYWKSVEASSKSTSIETKVDVAVEYSKFLRRYERTEEAEAVMRGVYSDVETRTEETMTHEESMSILTRVKAIAQEFKSLKSFSMARSIYSSLWERTRSSSTTSSSFSEEVASELAETVSEEMETRSDSMSTTTTLTTEEESTLQEVFESSLSMSSSFSSKSMSSSVMKTGLVLSSSYYSKEMYREAASTYVQILSHTWSSIETSESSVHEQAEEVIEMAMNLAECHFQMLQIEKSEIVYRNVFRCLLRSRFSHEWLIRRAKVIIEYHKRIYRFDKAVMYYRELCLHLQQRSGKSHSLTIEMLAEYGALAYKLGKRKESIEAYHHIYLAYKYDDGCIHAKGFEASLRLCEIHEEEHNWTEARKIYASLWMTLTKHRCKESGLSIHIERVYERYRTVLESHSTKEYESVRQLAIEYTQVCKATYGEKHELTVKATVQLAELCERSEAHREEAVSLYESALKHSNKTSMTTTMTTTTHTTEERRRSSTSTTTVSSLARQKLAKMYSSTEKSSTRAISLHEENLSSTRSEFGVSSSESLTATRELVTSYKRQETSESRSKAVSTLRSSVLEIFKTERSSERVFEAAHSLAQTYVSCGFKSAATSMVKELRETIIQQLRSSTRSESSLNVFLAAFEEVVSQRSFSATMADIRSEIFLHSSYFEALTAKSTRITTILERGVRLRVFLLESSRTEEVKRIDEELFSTFVKHFSASLTISTEDKKVHHTVIEALLSICTSTLTVDDDSQTAILDHGIETVRTYTNEGHFVQAHALATLLHRWVELTGGFITSEVVYRISRLSLYLAGRRTAKTCRHDNPTLFGRLLDLSRTLLRQALEASQALGIALAAMPLQDLDDIVAVLGEQRSYDDLAHVLAALWSDRAVHRTWSTPLVLAIGLRLVECRAAQGRVDDAIRVAEDIRYNLARVWGAVDSATLLFTNLLSRLYVTRGRYADAMRLHSQVLAKVISPGAGEHGEDGVVVSAEESAKAAVAQLEGAQKCIAFAGGWKNAGGVEQARFRELYAKLVSRFGGLHSWNERKPVPVEKWSTKADSKESWKVPETFSLRAVSYDGAKEGGVGLFDGAVGGRAKKASALRKVSNTVVMQGHRHVSCGTQQGNVATVTVL